MYLQSSNEFFVMVLLTDGNLVLYDSYLSEELWSSKTNNSGAIAATMQDDGKFVLLASNGSWIWATDTQYTWWLQWGKTLIYVHKLILILILMN